jgi:hypothetical protein
MQNQVNDELEQRELNRLAYANWCTIETQKVQRVREVHMCLLDALYET